MLSISSVSAIKVTEYSSKCQQIGMPSNITDVDYSSIMSAGCDCRNTPAATLFITQCVPENGDVEISQ